MKKAALLLLALTPALAASPQDHEDVLRFKQDFERAMALDDAAEMTKLVEDNHHEALVTVIETCEAIGTQSSAKLEKRIEGLRKAWQRAHDQRFVDNLYEYLSLLNPAYRSHRLELKSDLQSNRRAFDKAVAESDVHRFPGLGVEFATLAKSFADIEDHYYAAQAWQFAALCYEESNAGARADLGLVHEYLGHFLAEREEIDLRDQEYSRLKARHEALATAGHGVPPETEGTEGTGGSAGGDDVPRGGAGGKGAGGPGRAPATQPETISASMAFELVDDPYEYERPAYHADELFALWNSIGLGPRGSTSTIFTLDESPQVIRIAELQAAIDTDGDGEGDVEIPLTGGMEPVELTLGQGSDQRPWALLIGIGNERHPYQRIEVHLAPTPDALRLYFFNAASVVGELARTEVRVFDDDMDGVYGSYGQSWDLDGLAEGNFQPQIDSMVVGGGKRAVPFSEYARIGRDWYRLEAKRNGMELHATPQEGLKVGRLELDAEGVDPDYLVVKGEGKLQNCYFDLVEGGRRGLEVPAGQYKIHVGSVSEGKRQQTTKALILPGTSETVTVEPDGTATLEIGEPLSFDFEYVTEGEEVTIQGQSVLVRGRGGEVYDRIWNSVTRPEVFLSKKGRGRGGKGEEMRVVEIQTDPSIVEHGFAAFWRPLDLTLSIDKVGPEFEVRLVEEENRLLGEIESEWR